MILFLILFANINAKIDLDYHKEHWSLGLQYAVGFSKLYFSTEIWKF